MDFWSLIMLPVYLFLGFFATVWVVFGWFILPIIFSQYLGGLGLLAGFGAWWVGVSLLIINFD